jgi:hypothetical protein
MAARAKSDEDKRPWLELAEKWRRLAVPGGRFYPFPASPTAAAHENLRKE